MGWINEKKNEKKSRDTASLKARNENGAKLCFLKEVVREQQVKITQILFDR